ncbi:MAG TPA: DUF547 domain-containing protein [Vicinamibacterales bacterium]|nr:DUF547 domain-containing protein [Vicinamibacterales bacterium]
MRKLIALLVVVPWMLVAGWGSSVGPLRAAQERRSDASSSERRRVLDEILDLYVRDGEVYYRALKLDRAKVEAYVNTIANASIEGWSREEQLSFWINAYNGLVLSTVIDHYPIQGRSGNYPSRSVRQIPGAFERTSHRVAGRTLTLDQIEQTILPEFHDPRVFLALGRGAIGGGRLRSEAYTADRLEAQLTDVANECVSRPQCFQIEREASKISVSSIFSWREKDFSEAYAAKAPEIFAARSPIERAVIAFVQPKLLTTEKDYLASNMFTVAFRPFDWTLNDLTGRGGR